MAEESRKKGKERKETKEVNGHDISNIDKSKQRMKDTSLPANQMGQFDSTQVIMEGEDQPSKQDFGLEPALSITALDLTKQEFSRIPTPFSSDVYGQLYAMGGNLCMGTVDYPQESYEFWVMEIYGVLESWRRIGLTLGCESMSPPSVLERRSFDHNRGEFVYI
ncbi:hypothetical protein V6N13_050615 [Hibiscus sabdariffa]